MSQFTAFGKLTKTHGLNGEIFIFLFAKNADWIKSIKTFYLYSLKEKKNFKFSLEKFSLQANGLILKSTEIDSFEKAQSLKGHLFLLDKKDLNLKKGEFYLEMIKSFKVFEKEKYLGKIQSFMSHKAYDLICLDSEKLIPFLSQFIEKIDLEKKEIHLKLPEDFHEI